MHVPQPSSSSYFRTVPSLCLICLEPLPEKVSVYLDPRDAVYMGLHFCKRTAAGYHLVQAKRPPKRRSLLDCTTSDMLTGPSTSTWYPSVDEQVLTCTCTSIDLSSALVIIIVQTFGVRSVSTIWHWEQQNVFAGGIYGDDTHAKSSYRLQN